MSSKGTLWIVLRKDATLNNVYLLRTPESSPLGAWEWTTDRDDALRLPREKARYWRNMVGRGATTRKVAEATQ